MTVNEIKALNKQEVHAPMNLHEMAEQIRMFTIGNNIFFGELRVGSQCLRSLQTMIDRTRSTFKAMECLNTEFYAKFLFVVDTHYQIWPKQCKIAQNQRNMDNSIINFAHLVSQVLFGSFHISLLPTFKMKEPEATAATTANGKKDSSNVSKTKEQGKQKKKKPDKSHDLVKNKAPHPKLCMLATKTWAIKFTSKNMDKRPKWNNKCRCCLRWCLQKYCFSNCKNKESHIKANKIPAENLTSMKAWIKLCQSGNRLVGSGPFGIQPPPIPPNLPKSSTNATNPARTFHCSIPLSDTPVPPHCLDDHPSNAKKNIGLTVPAWTFHCSISLSDTPVPPHCLDNHPSSAKKNIGLTVLGEYLLCNDTNSDPEGRANRQTKKLQFDNSPADLNAITNPQDDNIIGHADNSVEDIDICSNGIKKRTNKTEQCYHDSYTKQHHPNSYTKQHHPDSHTKQCHPDSYTKQHHLDSYTKQRQQSSLTPNSYPKPSLAVWPPKLISILHQAMATPCQHSSKPIFKFDLSVKAAKKNFIILPCKFGGNLHKALHAQHELPLSYGSKFKTNLNPGARLWISPELDKNENSAHLRFDMATLAPR